MSEHCVVCGSEAPPDGGVSVGWRPFQGQMELPVYVPAVPSLLPIEVCETIALLGAGAVHAMIRIEPSAQTEVAAVGEIEALTSLVCPDCYSAPDRSTWRRQEWMWFFAELRRGEGTAG